MGGKNDNPTGEVKLGDTARIDRRNSVLAQIEAALLADQLSLEGNASARTGSDPYNSAARMPAPAAASVWNTKRPR